MANPHDREVAIGIARPNARAGIPFAAERPCGVTTRDASSVAIPIARATAGWMRKALVREFCFPRLAGRSRSAGEMLVGE